MKLRLEEFERIMDDHKFILKFATDNAAPCRHCKSTCAHYRMQVSWYPYEDVVQVFCVGCHVTDAFNVACGIIPADASAADVSKAHRIVRAHFDNEHSKQIDKALVAAGDHAMELMKLC
tara:strand:+ start:45 stop:401 length:357 start_codon:yes stop_codon:yes gene_type:complete